LRAVPETLHRDGSGGVNEKEVGELLLNFGIDLPEEELAVLTRRCLKSPFSAS